MGNATYSTHSPLQRQIHWLSSLWAGALFLCALVYLFPLDTPVIWGVAWLPALGIELSIHIDGLSRLFVLLITGIGFFIFLFSGNYLRGHPHFERFFLYLHLFMISMLGLVVADNLIMLFVFWELTSLTSYLLIGFNHKEERSRRAALQGLLITASGGLCLLAAFILIGITQGSFALSTILSDGALLKDHPWATGILVLLLLGALTKSAQFPFHFWLPNAMEAPTPVSAFLHSATMVKAGIYLLARFHPELSEATYWMPLLAGLGVITALLGGLFALQQRDLKQMAAYTTLMALGTLTALLSQPDPAVFAAAMGFLVAHALYKAALFLSIGALDHAVGQKYFSTLEGLWQRHRLFALAWLMTLLSLAGLPPAFGFIAKELLYDGLIRAESTPGWLLLGLLIANAMMVALAIAMARRIMTKKAGIQNTAFAPAEIAGPIVMAILGIALAVIPALSDPLIRDTLIALGGQATSAILPVALWHGLNWALAVSVVTVALGVLFSTRHRWVFKRLNQGQWFTWDALWDSFLRGFQSMAESVTGLLQTHKLSRDLSWILLTLVALGLFVLLSHDDRLQWHWEAPPLKLWLIGLLICAGTLLSLVAQSRIAAITGLGVVGIGVALVFIIFGAPDVAITQLLVETLLVVFIAVALLNLPSLPKQQGIRVGHALLSVAAGLLVTVTLWGIFTTDLDRSLTTYFEQTSYPEAFGRNIVNVILVDFRALDTFGEISVVLIAALGAIALLKDMRVKRR
jgi:multicomponent Na+:H+ antiporter subunit A